VARSDLSSEPGCEIARRPDRSLGVFSGALCGPLAQKDLLGAIAAARTPRAMRAFVNWPPALFEFQFDAHEIAGSVSPSTCLIEGGAQSKLYSDTRISHGYVLLAATLFAAIARNGTI